MKIATLGDFEIHLPTSGGKAGSGRNKTSSFQVRRAGVIVKQFRFSLTQTPVTARAAAWEKVREFVASAMQPAKIEIVVNVGRRRKK